MLRPFFKLNVADKSYEIEPTFEVHDQIEKALNKTLYNIILEAESLSIEDLYNIYRVLDCKNDMSMTELKTWIALNRNFANKQISDFISFLLLPEKQVD